MQNSTYHSRSPSQPKAIALVNANAQPKIFPGIVHERVRRRSIRQGSGSEKDVEPLSPLIKTSSRLGQASSECDDYDRVMTEEGDEAQQPRGLDI